MTDTDDRTTGMPCPTCKVDLLLSERQGIEIDYCPKCRGVWLDRGELDKIIERSAVEDAERGRGAPRDAGPGYRQDGPFGGNDRHGGGHGGGGHGGGKHYGKRHGGFLGRLFG
ncbi:MAG: recombination protein RecR [Sphingomonas sp.]|uniref:TFIIB-type zinc ribbon-containing protein n=1 Tax=Sphingomonas sp. TaxID=28214 RepID=UPI00120CC3D3|nr:MAG: recombination protein RecR [Sphingomonas sp.]